MKIRTRIARRKGTAAYSICAVMGLVTGAAAAGAEEPSDAPAETREYESPATGKNQRSQTKEELEWHDYPTSDRGTTFLDFWKSRQKVEPPTKLPRQEVPGFEPGARDQKADSAEDGAQKTRPPSPDAESVAPREFSKAPEVKLPAPEPKPGPPQKP